MSPRSPRYAGPVPRCPTRLAEDDAPQLSEEQLRVPTSELYSAALEAAWAEKRRSSASSSSSTGADSRPSPSDVDRLEPNPEDPTRPRPQHYGPYAAQRAAVDWSYHVVPSRARQALQDQIVELVLSQRLRECKDAGDDELCRIAKETRERAEKEGSAEGVDPELIARKDGEGERERPLALFTAGGMGAGKGHTLREMLKTDRIRLPANTVWIDPDALSRHLPERAQYLAADPSTASALLHPEASLLQEICAAAAREQKRSLVVDGSLTDCKWFEGFMRSYREVGYDCEILFVSAPEDVMLARAERRAKTTGRVTNPEAIKRSRIKSPECVTALSKPGLIRRVRLIDNSSDSSSSSSPGPQTLYDSARDPLWPGNSPTSYHPTAHSRSGACHCGADGAARARTESRERERGAGTRDVDEGGWVDARAFVDGVVEQGRDGRVRRKDRQGREGEGRERL